MEMMIVMILGNPLRHTHHSLERAFILHPVSSWFIKPSIQLTSIDNRTNASVGKHVDYSAHLHPARLLAGVNEHPCVGRIFPCETWQYSNSSGRASQGDVNVFICLLLGLPLVNGALHRERESKNGKMQRR